MYYTKHVTILTQTVSGMIAIDSLRLYRNDVLWETCRIGDCCNFTPMTVLFEDDGTDHDFSLDNMVINLDPNPEYEDLSDLVF